MSNGVNPSLWAVLFAAILIGAIAQGVMGFGFAFVAAPVLVLADPAALPAVLLLTSFPLVVLMAWRERGDIDAGGLRAILGGRIPGTLFGAALLVWLPGRILKLAFAALILLAVAMSLAGLVGSRESPGTTYGVAAGAVSGVMGTTVGMGSPPLALIYQNRSGPELRSTIAASMIIGVSFSLLTLTFMGLVQPWHLTVTAQLAPAIVIGLWLSKHVIPRVRGPWIRYGVLAFSAATAIAVIVLGAR